MLTADYVLGLVDGEGSLLFTSINRNAVERKWNRAFASN
jgi:hypothetical protein